MPSPTHRPIQTLTSPGPRDSKGAAIRRGDLKISDPIQLPHDVNHGPSHQFTIATLSNPTTMSTPQLDGTWPRKSVSPTFHTRTRSDGRNEPQSQRAASYNATSRISAGPSMLNGALSSAQSRGSFSKQKDSGFRAKIRRMFGSRRLREANLSSGTGGHSAHTVSWNQAFSSSHYHLTYRLPIHEFLVSS